MTKPQWWTKSIRVNPKTRKAVGMQTRIPFTQAEWDTLMAWLHEHKTELVETPEPEPPMPIDEIAGLYADQIGKDLSH